MHFAGSKRDLLHCCKTQLNIYKENAINTRRRNFFIRKWNEIQKKIVFYAVDNILQNCSRISRRKGRNCFNNHVLMMNHENYDFVHRLKFQHFSHFYSARFWSSMQFLVKFYLLHCALSINKSSIMYRKFLFVYLPSSKFLFFPFLFSRIQLNCIWWSLFFCSWLNRSIRWMNDSHFAKTGEKKLNYSSESEDFLLKFNEIEWIEVQTKKLTGKK